MSTHVESASSGVVLGVGRRSADVHLIQVRDELGCFGAPSELFVLSDAGAVQEGMLTLHQRKRLEHGLWRRDVGCQTNPFPFRSAL